jgi:hypothetical protein
MILLVEAGEVETRMGLNSVPEGAPTLGSAITAAHLRVQSLLDTKFVKASYVDTFYVDRNKTCGIVMDGYFRLRLKNGFLRASPVPVVKYGDTATACDTVAPGAVIDAGKGVVYLPEDYETDYITVAYDSGFETKDDAPDPLKEAILAYVPVVLEFSVNSTSSNNKITDSNKRAAILAHANDVMGPLSRGIGFAIDPIF